MDGATNRGGKALWKTMKKRLGFNAITICGSSWRLQTSDGQISAPARRRIGLPLIIPEAATEAADGMNLATALAAERGRSGTEEQSSGKTFRSPMGQLQGESSTNGGPGHGPGPGLGQEGSDSMCCVCMERKKDAAFIPCGHTYCRLCSREMWLNRGCCPLCNRSITDVLDIF